VNSITTAYVYDYILLDHCMSNIDVTRNVANMLCDWLTSQSSNNSNTTQTNQNHTNTNIQCAHSNRPYFYPKIEEEIRYNPDCEIEWKPINGNVQWAQTHKAYRFAEGWKKVDVIVLRRGISIKDNDSKPIDVNWRELERPLDNIIKTLTTTFSDHFENESFYLGKLRCYAADVHISEQHNKQTALKPITEKILHPNNDNIRFASLNDDKVWLCDDQKCEDKLAIFFLDSSDHGGKNRHSYYLDTLLPELYTFVCQAKYAEKTGCNQKLSKSLNDLMKVLTLTTTDTNTGKMKNVSVGKMTISELDDHLRELACAYQSFSGEFAYFRRKLANARTRSCDFTNNTRQFKNQNSIFTSWLYCIDKTIDQMNANDAQYITVAKEVDVAVRTIETIVNIERAKQTTQIAQQSTRLNFI